MYGKSFLRVLLAGLLVPVLANASVVINGTRVVYKEARGETIVQMRHPGDVPVLVQVWLDDGDENAEPQDLSLPFVITPTVSRMEPKGGQSVRILRTGGDLPQDRESMFFFNVLEVPPTETKLVQAGEDLFQFSTRSRVKFFYRPDGLMPAKAEKAPELVRFSLASDGAKPGTVQVKVHNPTPYHITFKDLTLHAGNSDTAVAKLTQAVGIYARTIAPMGEVVFPLESSSGLSSGASGLQVRYGVIGDLGETITGQKGLD